MGIPMDVTNEQLETQYAAATPHLRAYFLRQGVSPTETDDLLQETFLRAWRQREVVARAVSVRAYLFGIARHLGLDARRRARRSEPLVDDFPAQPVVVADERLELIRAAIGELPATHREPLLLKLQQELTYSEIAEVLELPVGTIRSRLHYAVQRLSETLQPGRQKDGKVNYE